MLQIINNTLQEKTEKRDALLVQLALAKSIFRINQNFADKSGIEKLEKEISQLNREIQIITEMYAKEALKIKV